MLVIAACGDEVAPDPRLTTPLATIDTLFAAYGVGDLGQEEIDRRLALERRFHLSDPEALRLCFADWDEPFSEGLAGYVFGSLIIAKDDLSATIREDEAVVAIRDPARRSRPVVLVREALGWRILLERSVPANARAQIEQKWRERQGEEPAP